jgi:hypothetical protein
LTAAVPVGSFPSGSYTLQVDRWYQDDIGNGDTITETLGVLPFTVEGAAAPPTPLPALGLPLLVALGALVALFAVLRLRYGVYADSDRSLRPRRARSVGFLS